MFYLLSMNYISSLQSPSNNKILNKNLNKV